MYEWEERKVYVEAIKKEEDLKIKERERLEKEIRKEKSYQAFKDWLKVSLLKQREELIQKKIIAAEKKRQKQIDKKTKENNKVMARIAYQEWKQRKAEQARH